LNIWVIVKLRILFYINSVGKEMSHYCVGVHVKEMSHYCVITGSVGLIWNTITQRD